MFSLERYDDITNAKLGDISTLIFVLERAKKSDTSFISTFKEYSDWNCQTAFHTEDFESDHDDYFALLDELELLLTKYNYMYGWELMAKNIHYETLNEIAPLSENSIDDNKLSILISKKLNMEDSIRQKVDKRIFAEYIKIKKGLQNLTQKAVLTCGYLDHSREAEFELHCEELFGSKCDEINIVND